MLRCFPDLNVASAKVPIYQPCVSSFKAPICQNINEWGTSSTATTLLVSDSITMGYQIFLVALSSLLLSCISAAPSKPEPIIQVRDRGTTLPFVARLNVSGSTLPEIDRAHVAGLKERARKLQNDSTHFQDKRQSSFGVINEAVFYVASVGVGTPASLFELIIDTGSSNTWVGSGRAFVETTSSQTNGQLMEVTYGSGFVVGQQCKFPVYY